jgi:hypothetical protein
MAYDEVQHRIIVGYRVPAKLIVYDSETGKEIFSGPMVGDLDDLYWDAKSKQVYISGGGGAVDIFRQTNDTTYKQIAHKKELEINQLVKRTVLDTQPITVQYELTEHGNTPQIIISNLTDWGIVHRKQIVGK